MKGIQAYASVRSADFTLGRPQILCGQSRQNSTGGRPEIAQSSRAWRLFGSINRDGAWKSLVQQPFGRRNHWLSMKEILHRAVTNKVAHGKENHSLVMCHPTTYEFAAFWRLDSGRGEIPGLAKAERTQPALLLHGPEISNGAGSIHGQGKKRGI